jgi:hypothetical protein
MNKILKPYSTLSVFLLCFILFSFQIPAINFPTAKDGKIDLSNWDFGEHAIVKLSGKWQFFEGKLIKTYPEEIQGPITFINVPDNWNYQSSGKQIISGQGYGSYRLFVRTNTKSALSIKVKDIATASKIWVNNKIFYNAGFIETIPSNNKPQFKPAIFNLPFDTNFFEIVVEVWNYNHQMGGLWDNIFIGRKEQISLQHERKHSKLFYIWCYIYYWFISFRFIYIKKKTR